MAAISETCDTPGRTTWPITRWSVYILQSKKGSRIAAHDVVSVYIIENLTSIPCSCPFVFDPTFPCRFHVETLKQRITIIANTSRLEAITIRNKEKHKTKTGLILFAIRLEAIERPLG